MVYFWCNRIRRKKKKVNDVPFGGIQVVLVGDFLQLPPVNASKGGKFCFEAKCWSQVIHKSFNLSHIFRQKGDADFIELLNEVRFGSISSKNEKLLKEAMMKKRDNSSTALGIEATKLYAKNIDVDSINDMRLQELSGEEVMFDAEDYVYVPHIPNAVDKEKVLEVSEERKQKLLDDLSKSARYKQTLKLKVGAQVMLLTNEFKDSDLVNGSQGKVVAFRDVSHGRYPEVEFSNGRRMTLTRNKFPPDPIFSFNPKFDADVTPEPFAQRYQVPLCLCYALTIHKSQGATLDYLEVSLADCFEYGQVYVALSRAVSLNGLVIRNFSPKKIRAHPKVLEV
jgi:ATP-dependent DNA helicase PIF1